jgi:hypothetical protein
VLGCLHHSRSLFIWLKNVAMISQEIPGWDFEVAGRHGVVQSCIIIKLQLYYY